MPTPEQEYYSHTPKGSPQDIMFKQGTSGLSQITKAQLIASIVRGWTFEEAGYTRGTRNKFSSAIKEMQPVKPLKDWSAISDYEEFYAKLPKDRKDCDIFKSSLGFCFIPCGPGIGLIESPVA